ncbi:hypothetical protein T09_11895, partial [Trichinella sp. T9]
LNFGIGRFFDIIMRYSLKMQSIVQYFVVFSKSFFFILSPFPIDALKSFLEFLQSLSNTCGINGL